MADEPITVEPIDEPPVPAATRGPLSYRTIRWISTIGVAPRWIDLMLLAVASVGVAFAFGSFGVLMIAETWGSRLSAVLVGLLAVAVVAATAWWSNHFKHHRIDDRSLPDDAPTDTNAGKTEPTSENVV